MRSGRSRWDSLPRKIRGRLWMPPWYVSMCHDAQKRQLFWKKKKKFLLLFFRERQRDGDVTFFVRSEGGRWAAAGSDREEQSLREIGFFSPSLFDALPPSLSLSVAPPSKIPSKKVSSERSKRVRLWSFWLGFAVSFRIGFVLEDMSTQPEPKRLYQVWKGSNVRSSNLHLFIFHFIYMLNCCLDFDIPLRTACLLIVRQMSSVIWLTNSSCNDNFYLKAGFGNASLPCKFGTWSWISLIGALYFFKINLQSNDIIFLSFFLNVEIQLVFFLSITFIRTCLLLIEMISISFISSKRIGFGKAWELSIDIKSPHSA